MSDPAAPPPTPSGSPSSFVPPGYGPPMPPPPMAYPQPAQSPVLGIVAVVLSVVLAPVGFVLGIITLATAKGRKSAKILGWVSVGVGLVITAIIVIVVVAVVRGIHDAENVSNQFLTDLQKQDVPAAYALTSSGFRANASETALQSFVTTAASELSAPRHIVSSHIGTSSNAGTYTNLIYEVDGAQTSYIDVRLVRENGHWRVLFVGPSGPP